MKNVTIYTLNYCPYCIRAKKILTDLGINFFEIDITDNEDERRLEVAKQLGLDEDMTLPQILFGSTLIGGCDDLIKLINEDKVNQLLED